MYEAVDKRSGTLIALKQFSIPQAETWKDVELAEREAQVLSQLSHPLLPRYVTHYEESGSLFLAMSKVEGKTLRDLRGSLGERDVILFLRDTAAVLAYLHGRAPPIIHRDIKPSNVIRNPAGHFVLVDFGSVQHQLRPEGGSTVVGTFGYMAPEQFQGRAMPATDLYAVGATALSMLTGMDPDALPHKGLSLDVPTALGRRRSDPLCGLLSEALDADPDARSRASLEQLLGKYGLSRDGQRPEPQPAAAGPWVSREAERANRHQRRRERRERRAEWRRYRHSRTPFGDRSARRWLRFPPALLAVLIALRVARVATSAALLLVVPVVLTLLSLVFGRELRRAAQRVREAGVRTSRVLEYVAQRALGVAQGSHETIDPSEVRVDDADSPPHVRVDDASDRPSAFEKDVANFEAEAERAAQQVEEAVSRRR
jgi:serine/threonine protein kinase